MTESVQRVLAAARRRLNQMRDLSDDLARIRGRASSADGMVTATVDSQGALVDLEFHRGVNNLTPTQFGTALVEASDAALRLAMAEKSTLIEAFNDEIAG
jgi:hypothetical protein